MKHIGKWFLILYGLVCMTVAIEYLLAYHVRPKFEVSIYLDLYLPSAIAIGVLVLAFRKEGARVAVIAATLGGAAIMPVAYMSLWGFAVYHEEEMRADAHNNSLQARRP